MTRGSLSAGAMAGATAAAAAGLAAAGLHLAAVAGHDAGHADHGLWNDFYSYWGGGRVLNSGGDPYDQHLLRDAYGSAGIRPVVGSGYSYPLALAELMRPLALMPPHAAALVFAALGLAGLVAGVALLLASLPHLTLRRALVWGLLIGVAPPVAGSLYVGQANLLLLPLLALAYRRVVPGPMLALAGAVKLFPATGLAALLVGGSRRRRQLAAGVAMLVALLLVPALLSPHASYGLRLGELLAPDAYWTNVSVNGLMSRLGLAFGGTAAPLPGLPVEAAVIALCGIVGVATLAVLVASGGRPWEAGLALSVALGVVVAPKNSVWNFLPLLLCVVALVATGGLSPRGRALLAAALVLLFAGAVGVLVTLLPGPPVASHWLGAPALLGALLLAGLTARRLDVEAPASRRTAARPRPWLRRRRVGQAGNAPGRSLPRG